MQKIDKKDLIILASNSPQRKRLLNDFAISFEVIPANIVENICKTWTAKQAVLELARQKAQDVVSHYSHLLEEGKFRGVLAADTVVVLQEQILGKPQNLSEAYEMIWNLSRTAHQVITGMCFYTISQGYDCDYCVTDIVMKPMTKDQIDYYIATNNVLERAGAVDIENIGYIQEIRGDFNNVVGLPVKQAIERWFSM